MRLVRALAPVVASFGGGPERGLILLAIFGFVAAPSALSAAPPPVSFAEIVERVAPAVVNISTTQAITRGEMPDFPFPEPPPGSFQTPHGDHYGRRVAMHVSVSTGPSCGIGCNADPVGCSSSRD